MGGAIGGSQVDGGLPEGGDPTREWATGWVGQGEPGDGRVLLGWRKLQSKPKN